MKKVSIAAKWVTVFICLVTAVFASPQHPLRAQDAPLTIIDAAYKDLSQRVGSSVVRGGNNSFKWVNDVFADTSLDCPQTGQTYVQAVTAGYRITIFYGGTTYNYRANQNGSILFLCAGTGAATIIAPTQPGSSVSNPGTSTGATSSNGSTGSTGSLSGSGTTAPLVMLLSTGKPLGGDLFEWTGSSAPMLQMSTWGYNFQPVVSPNGRWVTYLSTPKAVVDNNMPITNTLANIWLLDIASGTTTRIADQPAGSATLISRIVPSWSPDSKSLVWMEQNQGNLILAIYDVANKNTIQFKLPPTYNIGADATIDRFRVLWGEPGIALIYQNPGADQGYAVAVVTRDGGQIGNFKTTLNLLDWVKDGDNSYLAGWSQSDKKWLLVGAITGETVDMGGSPELYSRTAPNGISLARSDLYTVPTQWQLYDGQSVVPITNVWGVGISPDGKQAAIQTGQATNDVNQMNLSVTIYTGAKASPLPTGNKVWPDLVWGPVAWRVRHNP